MSIQLNNFQDLWTAAGITSENDFFTEKNNLTNAYGSFKLAQVKSHLTSDTSLSAVKKLILSDEQAYICTLLITCRDGNGGFTPFTDAVQLAYSVKITLDEVENLYIDALVNDVLASNSIDLNANQSGVLSAALLKAQIVNELKAYGVDLDNPDAQVLGIYSQVRQMGAFTYLVECFLNTGEVDANMATDAIKAEMARYLYSMNLNLTAVAGAIGTNNEGKPVFVNSDFDGYMAQAWAHALRVDAGADDPISQIYGQGEMTSWNFMVDDFSDIEDIEISVVNIRAAGALYYIYWLDQLGMFEATDMIVMLWVRGSLSLSQGEAANKLYRYYKKRDDRMTKEERAMTYRQVFGLGNAAVLNGGIENTEFSHLMDGLMNQVVEFIQKIEGLEEGNHSVSIEGLSQSIRDLQYNISSYTVGKPQQDSYELHAQLQDCISILRDPEIVAQLAGGRQRNMWTVLERVLKEHLKRPANISASKTVAVEGNKMFNFMATFDHYRRHTTDFSSFLRSSEAFIVGQSQLEPQINRIENVGSEEAYAEVIDDDFENWD